MLKKGFTIIELIIAIAISSIFLTTGIVKYIDFNKTQTIKAAGQTLKNNLRNIQNKAITGSKPSGTCTILDGYRVTINSTTQYNTQAVCDITNLIGDVTSYSLPSGIFIDSPAPGNTFDFLVLGKGASSNTTILLKNSLTSPTKWYGVCVSVSGDIKDCGYSSGPEPTCTC